MKFLLLAENIRSKEGILDFAESDCPGALHMIIFPFLLATQCSGKSLMVISPDLHIGDGAVWCRTPRTARELCWDQRGRVGAVSDTKLGVLFALNIYHPPSLPAGNSGLG